MAGQGIEFDPEKVREIGPLAVRMLGRLANAIILQQRLGIEFDQSIKVEMGDAVALLVKCVKGEENEKRTTASTKSGSSDGARDDHPVAKGLQSGHGRRSLADTGFLGTGPRIRGKRATPDPGKSAKGEE